MQDVIGAIAQAHYAEMLSNLKAVIRLNSENPPGREEGVAHFLCERLQALGAQVELQVVEEGRPNVIGTFDFGPGPTLLFNAHTDTVPVAGHVVRDLFDPVVEDGRLYGRGACDDKGPLIAMLTACAAATDLVRQGHALSGRLIFTGVMGEESTGAGTRYIAEHGPRADWAIVGEPTELEPVLGHKGSYRRRLTFYGTAAHSSDPSLGVNAIYRAARFVLEVERWNERLQTKSDPLFGSPVVSANVIQGGFKVIVIPDLCQVEIDRRLLPGETEATVQAEVAEILARLRDQDPELTVDIGDLSMDKAPSAVEPDSELAQTLKASVEAVSGRPASFRGYRAGTDMTFLAAAGVPTVIFGPGSIGKAHSTDEYVPLAEMEQAISVYTQVIWRLLGQAAR